MITIEDFNKIELRVGTILEAEEVPGSEKLIKQIVDFGELGTRQVLSGIKQWYKNPSPGSGTLPFADAKRKPSHPLVGKQFVYVVNLEPRIMMGYKSEGMILATDTGKPILIKPSKKVPSGSKIR